MTQRSIDWNDLHVAHGLDAVREQIRAQLAAAETAPESAKNADQRQLGSGGSAEGRSTPAGAAREAPASREWMDRLARNDKGALKSSVANFALVLDHDERVAGRLGYCDFSYRIYIRAADFIAGCKQGEIDDADLARLRVWFGQQWGITPSTRDLTDAVLVVSQQHRFHPVRDYLRSLIWDGTDRLDHWMADVFEAADNSEYLAAVGRFFPIGAVARVMRPGAKMDNVLILEGAQGLKKSTALEVLFGAEWFSDTPISMNDKDSHQNAQGIWCMELAELDSFNRAETTTAKAFFSQRKPRYRPSYGHLAKDFPRQCVFAGTTNQEEYLKDYSGNRRYWPVWCRTVNIDYLRHNRDQLWAEALARYEAGEKWYPESDHLKALFATEQEKRMQLDPWHYLIEDFLRLHLGDYVTGDQVLQDACKKKPGEITKADQNRVAPIIKAIGWHKTRRTVLVGSQEQRRHVYVKPENWI